MVYGNNRLKDIQPGPIEDCCLTVNNKAPAGFPTGAFVLKSLKKIKKIL